MRHYSKTAFHNEVSFPSFVPNSDLVLEGGVVNGVFKKQKIKIDYVNSDYTLQEDNELLLINASISPIIITLIDSVAIQGRIFHFKKVDNSNNEILIIPILNQTIDNNDSILFSVPNNSYSLVAISTGWVVL